MTVTNRENLINDEKFNSVAARAKNVAEWFEVRGYPLTNKTTEEWLSLLQQADIAAQPCHTLESLPDDNHLKAVKLIQTEQHHTEGKVSAIRSSIKVDYEYLALRECAQPKGWETQKILQELGYEENDVRLMLNSSSALTAVKKNT